MQERSFSDTAVLAKLDEVLVYSSGEGFTSKAAFAALPPVELHADYLKSLGITAKGTQMQLISLHSDLHAQHTAASSPTPSTGSAPASPAFTPDEVKVPKAELRNMQKQPGGAGGAKGGFMQQQTQCNAVDHRTGQPYTMDELVAVLHRHESMLERVGSGVEEALSTALRVAEFAAPDALPRSSDKGVNDPAVKEALFGKMRNASAQ
jgi:hypothetical protein